MGVSRGGKKNAPSSCCAHKGKKRRNALLNLHKNSLRFFYKREKWLKKKGQNSSSIEKEEEA